MKVRDVLEKDKCPLSDIAINGTIIKEIWTDELLKYLDKDVYELDNSDDRYLNIIVEEE